MHIIHSHFCYLLITQQILPPLLVPCHWQNFMRGMSSFLPKNFILIVQSNYIINICLCGLRCRFFISFYFSLFCCKFNDSRTELLLQSNYYIPRKWVLLNRFSALNINFDLHNLSSSVCQKVACKAQTYFWSSLLSLQREAMTGNTSALRRLVKDTIAERL